MLVHHSIFLAFLFALGACVGSFLNVVVWRLPQVEAQPNDGFFRVLLRSINALSDPPSHCPKCDQLLKWYDNLPIIGWFKLGGKCRFCKQPISFRYPLIETIMACMFAGYYWAFFIAQIGPAIHVDPEGRMHPLRFNIVENWPIYFLDMMLLSGLLAASLIDAELFIIPIEIPWLIAATAVVVHAFYDMPSAAGNVMAAPLPAAVALGGAIGIGVSFLLLSRKILKLSFADGAPMLEIEKKEYEKERKKIASSRSEKKEDDEPREWTPTEIRREIRHEIAFLLCPVLLAFVFGVLAFAPSPLQQSWLWCASHNWVIAILGSLFGALVGGGVVWITRILGTLAFGREAMGMGDVDLMVAVGAVLGAGHAVAAFFAAPFFGIAVTIYMIFARKGRELPYGPYLSLGTAGVILFFPWIAAYFLPGFSNIIWIIHRNFFPGGG